MKRLFLLILAVIIGIGIWRLLLVKSTIGPMLTQAQTMIILASPNFNEGGIIPVKYTCDGENASPALDISNVPSNAQSLVIILTDPDAPSGNFTHWVLWNIDPKTGQIPEGMKPGTAVSGTNDAGTIGYFGPCPPSGTHRYIFQAYALNTSLNLPSSAKKDDLTKAMNGHIVAQGELLGKYTR